LKSSQQLSGSIPGKVSGKPVSRPRVIILASATGDTLVVERSVNWRIFFLVMLACCGVAGILHWLRLPFWASFAIVITGLLINGWDRNFRRTLVGRASRRRGQTLTPSENTTSRSCSHNLFQCISGWRQVPSATEHGFIPVDFAVVKPFREGPFVEGTELLHVDSVPMKQCQKFSQCVLIDFGLGTRMNNVSPFPSNFETEGSFLSHSKKAASSNRRQERYSLWSQIHRERIERGVCSVGKVRRTSQRSATFILISPEAEWDVEESFLLRDITLVEFGGAYERLLLQRAKPLPTVR